MFTLEDAECLALCGNAPCVTANWRFFGDVDEERFDTLIEDLRAGRLDAEVPPHGTLIRVRRSVGLLAGAPGGDQKPADATDGKEGQPAAVPQRAEVRPDGGTVPPAAHVDLDTHRTTPAVLSLDAGQLEAGP
jgi:hypothetical protein